MAPGGIRSREVKKMKNSICISVAVLVCATCSAPARGQRLLERVAQPLLDRLEEELQQQTVSRRIVAEGSAAQQGYLGIVANDALEDGHGVRVLSVGAAGPADAGADATDATDGADATGGADATAARPWRRLTSRRWST